MLKTKIIALLLLLAWSVFGMTLAEEVAQWTYDEESGCYVSSDDTSYSVLDPETGDQYIYIYASKMWYRYNPETERYEFYSADEELGAIPQIVIGGSALELPPDAPEATPETPSPSELRLYENEDGAIAIDLPEFSYALSIPQGLALQSVSEQTRAKTMVFAVQEDPDATILLNVKQDGAYEGYTFSTLPESVLAQMDAYYTSAYAGSEPVILETDNVGEVYFVDGLGSDGHPYRVYILMRDGIVLTASLGTLAAELTEESIGLAESLLILACECL